MVSSMWLNRIIAGSSRRGGRAFSTLTGRGMQVIQFSRRGTAEVCGLIGLQAPLRPHASRLLPRLGTSTCAHRHNLPVDQGKAADRAGKSPLVTEVVPV